MFGGARVPGEWLALAVAYLAGVLRPADLPDVRVACVADPCDCSAVSEGVLLGAVAVYLLGVFLPPSRLWRWGRAWRRRARAPVGPEVPALFGE